jgi:hypothetical protein
LRRRVHLDDRGMPVGSTVEYDAEDARRGGYQLLRLFFLLPLLPAGFLCGVAAHLAGWHPMLSLALGFAIPIAGGAILHFFPWVRAFYDGALTIGGGIIAFIAANTATGDLIWSLGAAALVLLIGGWMTFVDVKADAD